MKLPTWSSMRASGKRSSPDSRFSGVVTTVVIGGIAAGSGGVTRVGRPSRVAAAP